MKRNWLIALGAAAAFLTVSASGQAEERHYNLKLSYWVPSTHMLTPGFKDWIKAVEKASKGTITATLFPASQLGSGKDEYDLVRRGIADFGLISPGYTPGRFPVIGAPNLPFVITDGLKAAPAVYRWYMPYAAKEMADVHVCHVFTDEPGQFHSRGPIRVPSDIKGLNIRAGDQTIAEYVTSMGGNAVQVPIMEAYDTLKRGLTDGIAVTWGGLKLFNLGKVTNYSLKLPIYVSPFVDVINKQVYDSMSPMQKKAIDSTCTAEWSARIYHYWHKQQVDFRAEILKEGKRHITEVSPDVAKQWRDAAKPVYDEWAKAVAKAGYDPKEVMGKLRTGLQKVDAGF